MKQFSSFRLFLLAFVGALLLTGCDAASLSPDLSGGNQGSSSSAGLTVHFIDVGQADAALIVCDGDAMLIDGGNADDSSLIYSYLQQQNISELKYLVGTHAHEDHMGGLAGAAHAAQVETAFCSVTECDSKFFRNTVSSLAEQGVALTVPEPGSSYTLGSAEFEFLGPLQESDNTNNMSLVLRLVYGNTSFLFTGDAERSEEGDILDAGYTVSATVLKVGHHGSDSSTTYPFLRAVDPQYAVISCGKNNSYGHPSEETLSRLRDADVTLYRTDLQGTILCKSDGRAVTFTTEKNAEIQTNPTENQTVEYVGNLRSKVFHRSSCPNLPQAQNRILFKNRSAAIGAGYSPCGKCNP